MTYKERLEQLLQDSIRKSELYISGGRTVAGASHLAETSSPEDAFSEWETAELAYTDFLDFLKMNQIRPGDKMPA